MKTIVAMLLVVSIISGCIKSEDITGVQKSIEISNFTKANESSVELKSKIREAIIDALEKSNRSEALQ